MNGFTIESNFSIVNSLGHCFAKCNNPDLQFDMPAIESYRSLKINENSSNCGSFMFHKKLSSIQKQLIVSDLRFFSWLIPLWVRVSRFFCLL
jgi:hypothetical protein